MWKTEPQWTSQVKLPVPGMSCISAKGVSYELLNNLDYCQDCW